MSSYLMVNSPERIPVPGNKIIEEYIGTINTDTAGHSVARRFNPPDGSEPAQKPYYDEYSIMICREMNVMTKGEQVIPGQGAGVLIRKGNTVKYSGPLEKGNEHRAFCIPAFSPEQANRYL